MRRVHEAKRAPPEEAPASGFGIEDDYTPATESPTTSLSSADMSITPL